MIQIHPYKLGSKGAMALKEYINNAGVKCIVSHNRKGNPNIGRLIVGWGAKNMDFVGAPKDFYLNGPEDAKVLSCKLRFFEEVDDAEGFIPEWTTLPEVARAWGTDIVVRATTTGSGGDGITIVPAGQLPPKAPLYTKYQKKTQEYRVHCFRKPVQKMDGVAHEWSLDHYQKKIFIKTEERPEPLDWKIRNHTQGFIFQTVEEIPAKVREACEAVLEMLGVDFCALDVIHHKPTNVALVLEGNTAPGLEDGRLKVYGDYLIERHKEFKNG